MITLDQSLVEAAAAAYARSGLLADAIAAVAPLIARQERERCAGYHDEQAMLCEICDRGDERYAEWSKLHKADASAIRALGEDENNG